MQCFLQSLDNYYVILRIILMFYLKNGLKFMQIAY